LSQQFDSLEVGTMIYRGNTVSYLYDKMTAYQNQLGRVRDKGIATGRIQREPEIKELRDRVKRLEVLLSLPEPPWKEC